MTLTISFDGMSSWPFPQTNLQVVLHDLNCFCRHLLTASIQATCQGYTIGQQVHDIYGLRRYLSILFYVPILLPYSMK